MACRSEKTQSGLDRRVGAMARVMVAALVSGMAGVPGVPGVARGEAVVTGRSIATHTVTVRDTLAIRADADAGVQAKLEALSWPVAEFEAVVSWPVAGVREGAEDPGEGRSLRSRPSPGVRGEGRSLDGIRGRPVEDSRPSRGVGGRPVEDLRPSRGVGMKANVHGLDGPNGADGWVTFPSAVPSGDGAQDTVWLLWYAARDGQGLVAEAPAIVVVHSLHPRYAIGRGIARGFADRGLHAFVLVLPGFGPRADAAGRQPGVVTLLHGRQVAADVRRARDVAASLPRVSAGPVAIQGTSLGGFVAAVGASLDGAFDPVILLLSGADVMGVLREGRHDAARLNAALRAQGLSEQALAAVVDAYEPMHFAHRLDPARTWLISARQDNVVPPASGEALARAIGLGVDHHVKIDGDHYSALLLMPSVTRFMAERVLAGREAVVDRAAPPPVEPERGGEPGVIDREPAAHEATAPAGD